MLYGFVLIYDLDSWSLGQSATLILLNFCFNLFIFLIGFFICFSLYFVDKSKLHEACLVLKAAARCSASDETASEKTR